MQNMKKINSRFKFSENKCIYLITSKRETNITKYNIKSKTPIKRALDIPLMATRYFFVGPSHVSSTQNLVLYISDETRENNAVVTNIRNKIIVAISAQIPQNKPYYFADGQSIQFLDNWSMKKALN